MKESLHSEVSKQWEGFMYVYIPGDGGFYEQVMRNRSQLLAY